MHLPPEIRRYVEDRADAIGFPALKRAATAMSDAYREGLAARDAHLTAAERAAAYLVTRMPATYAAAFRVMEELNKRLAGRPIATVLDLGAGTGAASLAARQFFPDAAFTLLERDGAFADAARALLPGASVRMDDVSRMESFPQHDLVIASYSLGELPPAIAERLWNATKVAMVAIEPGTPAGFARIRTIRDQLLARGAHMAAPCPAETPCPLPESDWCHFAARVERSSLHRRVKGGELNYEDEKFSYVALVREPVQLCAGRIIRHPQQRPGLVMLELCGPEGTHPQRVSRHDKPAFKKARAAAWGDDWE